MGVDLRKLLGLYILLLIIIILLTSVFAKCNAQKFELKKHIAPAAAVFVAGMSDGLNQALQFRYSGFKRVFPKANDKWYNPSISWKNKYKNGDPSQGAKYFGSTTFFVGLTDAYHATRTISNSFNAAAIVFSVSDGKKRWWVYLLEIGAYWTLNMIGFSIVYNIF